MTVWTAHCRRPGHPGRRADRRPAGRPVRRSRCAPCTTTTTSGCSPRASAAARATGSTPRRHHPAAAHRGLPPARLRAGGDRAAAGRTRRASSSTCAGSAPRSSAGWTRCAISSRPSTEHWRRSRSGMGLTRAGAAGAVRRRLLRRVRGRGRASAGATPTPGAVPAAHQRLLQAGLDRRSRPRRRRSTRAFVAAKRAGLAGRLARRDGRGRAAPPAHPRPLLRPHPRVPPHPGRHVRRRPAVHRDLRRPASRAWPSTCGTRSTPTLISTRVAAR